MKVTRNGSRGGKVIRGGNSSLKTHPLLLLYDGPLDVELLGGAALALHLVPRLELDLLRLYVQLAGLLGRRGLQRLEVDVAELGGVEGDELGLDLLEEGLDLGLLALGLGLVGVRLQGVEVGLAGAWNFRLKFSL